MNTTKEIRGAITTAHAYDDNGNFYSTGAYIFALYDYRNRTGRIYSGTGGNQVTRTYEYDPFGRRIQKVYRETTNGNWLTRRYNYVGENAIQFNDASDSVQKKFVYGLGLDDVVEYEETSSDSLYYYHKNRLGSIQAITERLADPADSQQVEQARYEEFGNTSLVQIDGSGASSVSTSQIGNDWLYTGREWNAEDVNTAQRYYFRARSYDSNYGVFRQRDPMGYGDGPSLYPYAGDDPIDSVDLLGQTRITVYARSGDSSSSSSGHWSHMWVEVAYDDGTTETWGFYPDGLHDDSKLKTKGVKCLPMPDAPGQDWAARMVIDMFRNMDYGYLGPNCTELGKRMLSEVYRPWGFLPYIVRIMPVGAIEDLRDAAHLAWGPGLPASLDPHESPHFHI